LKAVVLVTGLAAALIGVVGAEEVFAVERGATARAPAARTSAESGIASVYSTDSGSRVASGGNLNPGALTAAHRTLPFGSKVLVTNKRNGRSVVVTINDRGPFVRGRVIDVTPAAAKVLGFSGLTSVSLEKHVSVEKNLAPKTVDAKLIEPKPIETKPIATKPIATGPSAITGFGLSSAATKPVVLKPLDTTGAVMKPGDTPISEPIADGKKGDRLKPAEKTLERDAVIKKPLEPKATAN
jgi:rare lipoprotein A